jgi:hypothetical protein
MELKDEYFEKRIEVTLKNGMMYKGFMFCVFEDEEALNGKKSIGLEVSPTDLREITIEEINEIKVVG